MSTVVGRWDVAGRTGGERPDAVMTALAACVYGLAVIGCDAPSTRGGDAGTPDSGVDADPDVGAGGAGGGAVDGAADVSLPVAGIAGCAATALPPGTGLHGIWIGPAGEVWVAGDGGFVGRRAPDAAGGSWSWCRPGATVALHAIWGASGDDVWAVGDAGTILRWNGAAWATEDDVGAPAPGDLHDVWGQTTPEGYSGLVWVIGDGGVVRRFDGVAWQVADADTRYLLRGVWGSPSGLLRVVGFAELPFVFGIPGQEALVLRSEPTGAWNREAVYVTERGAASFQRISGASDNDVWAVGIKLPSGAAAGFAFAVHFDGSDWTIEAGIDAPSGAPEEVIIDRSYPDVAVSTPDAPNGAWFAAGFRNAVRFDGVSWSSSDPVTTWLEAIDVRGPAMWAAGNNGKVVRWTPAGWVVSNAQDPPLP